MKHSTRTLVVAAIAMAAIAVFALAPSARASAIVGQAAPDFKVPDTSGVTHSLGEYKGRFVVLEWVNFECPFVGKHYGSGHMQMLQKEYTGKGVVWLSINSSARGQQGYYAADKVEALVKEKGAAPTAYLLDTAGTVGRAYGAKTTPHMFVIDPTGKLIYQGAIDDKPTTDQADIKTARNYLNEALNAAMAGKPVPTATTRPYGCSVKYKD
jgi:AhpC/TSA family protein